jgi:hypothetical protein
MSAVELRRRNEVSEESATHIFVSRLPRRSKVFVEIVPANGECRSQVMDVRHVNVANFSDVPRPFVLHFPHGKGYPAGVLRIGPNWPMPDDYVPAALPLFGAAERG